MTAARYNEEQVRELASAVVTELFLKLGIDANDPKSLTELRRDLDHLSTWRKSTEMVMSKGLAAAVTFTVSAMLGYVVYLATGRFLH